MADYLAIDAGLTFAGDPQWFYDLDVERQRLTMAYLFARAEQAGGLWSASGLRATDVVHLLSAVTGAKKGKGGGDSVSVDSLFDQLWSPED